MGVLARIYKTFTSTVAGLVPASGGGTTNFLRADGTWNAPAGGVTSVTSTGSTLTITGSTTTNAEINLGHANTWTACQTITKDSSGGLIINGSESVNSNLVTVTDTTSSNQFAIDKFLNCGIIAGKLTWYTSSPVGKITIDTTGIDIAQSAGLNFYVGDANRDHNASAKSVNITVGSSHASAGMLNVAMSDTSASAGNNIGFNFSTLSSTGASQQVCIDKMIMPVATNASFTSRRTISMVDFAATREVIRTEANGTAALIGFFGTTAAAQQTGGAATASGTYGSTEQTMLQTAYNALRTYGLLT